MIGHQNVRMQVALIFLKAFKQGLHEEVVITFIEKAGLLVISPLHDMLRDAR